MKTKTCSKCKTVNHVEHITTPATECDNCGHVLVLKQSFSKKVDSKVSHPSRFNNGEGAYALCIIRGYDRTVVGLFERSDAGNDAMNAARKAIEPHLPEGSILEVHC